MTMFSFPLSDFQTESIQAITDGHHSLVTAHTGSGKSVPAEFAIQHFTKLGRKVIYTSPIKALSNQKFYEFSQRYADISFGIMTGDIKLNPDAEVVIMTTELLLNLLVSASLVNVACVIFDEVHYINDADRGRVWEQCILMMPNDIQMVMLSATIDAPEKFAQWCERKGRKVVISSTAKRIVPLTHYGYLTVNEGSLKSIKDKAVEAAIRSNTNRLIPLKSEDGQFSAAGHKELTTTKELIAPQKRQHVINSLALHLRDRDMLPAIVFVFSRKHTELLAMEITVPLLEFDSKVAYTVRRECEQIVRKLPNHAEYTSLPEYEQLVSLLEKGVGVHHSGMIPVLREIVELMISKKYIKMLFATESFAVGLNCPIRTAVFTSLTKFDGIGPRYLLPHEYNQAASRCGRRGIDVVGHVVHCCNLFDMPTATEYKEILCGKPQTLVSKFQITFALVLQLCKQPECSIDTMVSFINNSMMRNELDKAMNADKAYLLQLAEKLIDLSGLKTPHEKCARYIELGEMIPMVANKRRKELEREQRNLTEEYRWIQADADMMRKNNKVYAEIASVERGIANMDDYIEGSVANICDVLRQRGFMNGDGLTANGLIASGLAEVHPLIAADLIESWSLLTAKQLVGVLSCFTDVKIEADSRIGVPTSSDSVVKKQIELLVESVRIYEQLDKTMDYSDMLIFDMTDIMMAWCDLNNEQECIAFIRENLLCSIGDFTKAILKISAICREFAAANETNVAFRHTLSFVDGLILKYVATAQSLYL